MATGNRAPESRKAPVTALKTLLLPLLAWSAAALAIAPEPRTEAGLPSAQAAALLAKASSLRVDHIPKVHRIEHWQALGNKHVLLDIDATRSYLLTLASPCHQLGWAQSVDVSRSGNDIWSQFDYVNADGWRCSIGTIHQLGRK